MMADSGSEDIAVVGNTDLTPSALENNIKNTVKISLHVSLITLFVG